MSLIDTIKTEYLAQRKARASWQVASLSTLIGEIETLAKGGKGELTDAVVVTVVKKFIKNIDETLKVLPSSSVAEAALLRSERELFEQFMPKQLSEQELRDLIEDFARRGMTDIGDAMKTLKAQYGGQYDGALASSILKTRFAK